MRKAKGTADVSPLSNNRMGELCRMASVAMLHGNPEKARGYITRVYNELFPPLTPPLHLTNQHRADYGAAAVGAGTPDFDENEPDTNVTDTFANIMHYCYREGINLTRALSMAEIHFNEEVAEER